jgi:hypothetical protein
VVALLVYHSFAAEGNPKGRNEGLFEDLSESPSDRLVSEMRGNSPSDIRPLAACKGRIVRDFLE